MIHTCKTSNEEFFDLIRSAVIKLDIKENELLESYLAGMLAEYLDKTIEAKNYYKAYLAGFLNKGFHGELGDELLFMSGFFPEYLVRKASLGYFIAMGKSSYSMAASAFDYCGLGEIYGGLSERFEDYVTVLDNINNKEYDIATEFEKWAATGNMVSLQFLGERGVFPTYDNGHG